MMAPVVGSGDWPPWMQRVAKARRLAGPGVDGSVMVVSFQPFRRSLHAAAQVVQEVDAGDEAEEPLAVLDDGDVVAGEDRQQVRERRRRSDSVQLARHCRGDAVAEPLLVVVDG